MNVTPMARCKECGWRFQISPALANGQPVNVKHGAGICPHCQSYNTEREF